MLHIIGTTLLWILGLALAAIFPLDQLARGMASNPDSYKTSKAGCLFSLIGLALLIALAREAFGGVG